MKIFLKKRSPHHDLIIRIGKPQWIKFNFKRRKVFERVGRGIQDFAKANQSCPATTKAISSLSLSKYH